MIPEGQVRLLTQTPSVDTQELLDFLGAYAETVTVDEVHPGPQASVDWFLPANLELAMNAVAAHPFIGSFLGVVSAHLTSAFAKESLKKVAEKFGEAIINKAAEDLWGRLLGVFHRSKEHNVNFSRAGKAIPVPPLRLTLGVPIFGTLAPVKLRLVFTTELSDKDFHSAYRSVGKVIEHVMTTMEDRARYEHRINELVAEGQTEKAEEMWGSEHYLRLRQTTFTYAYLAGERAWVDAHVLAVQRQLERRLESLRQMLKGPSDVPAETLREMIADIEHQIEDARVS